MSDPKIAQFQQAGLKAARYTQGFQLPDGGYIWEGYPGDAFHKEGYSWGVAGLVEPAHRLFTWAKANRLQPDGQLQEYCGDVYKHSWFFQGAHRFGRFDLSYPVASFLLTCQAPCGGFPHFAGEPYCRALSTCMAGLCMLYMGNLKAARQVAAWTAGLLEQPDESRFYYRTTQDGTLVTPAVDPDGALFVDLKQGQVYWEIGLPLQLMCRMFQATGERAYLRDAGRFFEWTLRCAADSYAFTGSGKSALGAAAYYLLTGDKRARAAAVQFGDFLLETQRPDGTWMNPSWPPEVLYGIDAAAEFNVWLQEIAAVLPGADAVWG